MGFGLFGEGRVLGVFGEGRGFLEGGRDCLFFGERDYEVFL